jgi:hypothetical protein
MTIDEIVKILNEYSFRGVQDWENSHGIVYSRTRKNTLSMNFAMGAAEGILLGLEATGRKP